MIATGPVLSGAPLDPSGGEARSWLRQELLHPEYHQQNVVEQALAWLQRQVDKGIDAASHAPPLSTFAAMLVFLLLAGGLVWLLSRASRTAGQAAGQGPVLADVSVTADQWRTRAETALTEGRHAAALVDGFRALAVRQVERGRLDDLPGATAHEVATALATAYPEQRERVGGCAALFDLVLYGDRPASREQAAAVLALDDELAGRRTVPWSVPR